MIGTGRRLESILGIVALSFLAIGSFLVLRPFASSIMWEVILTFSTWPVYAWLERALGALYKPDGYNIGMNLGRVAGAGVADHLHLHVLPRWAGDTSFMTTVGETRLEPEDLATTFAKLKPHFQ